MKTIPSSQHIYAFTPDLIPAEAINLGKGFKEEILDIVVDEYFLTCITTLRKRQHPFVLYAQRSCHDGSVWKIWIRI